MLVRVIFLLWEKKKKGLGVDGSRALFIPPREKTAPDAAVSQLKHSLLCYGMRHEA